MGDDLARVARCPLYDDDAAITTTTTDPGSDQPTHQLDSACPSALPAPRHTAAIAQLSQALNDTNTNYPGTDLTLRYSIKSHL